MSDKKLSLKRNLLGGQRVILGTSDGNMPDVLSIGSDVDEEGRIKGGEQHKGVIARDMKTGRELTAKEIVNLERIHIETPDLGSFNLIRDGENLIIEEDASPGAQLVEGGKELIGSVKRGLEGLSGIDTPEETIAAEQAAAAERREGKQSPNFTGFTDPGAWSKTIGNVAPSLLLSAGFGGAISGAWRGGRALAAAGGAAAKGKNAAAAAKEGFKYGATPGGVALGESAIVAPAQYSEVLGRLGSETGEDSKPTRRQLGSMRGGKWLDKQWEQSKSHMMRNGFSEEEVEAKKEAWYLDDRRIDEMQGRAREAALASGIMSPLVTRLFGIGANGLADLSIREMFSEAVNEASEGYVADVVSNDIGDAERYITLAKAGFIGGAFGAGLTGLVSDKKDSMLRKMNGKQREMALAGMVAMEQAVRLKDLNKVASVAEGMQMVVDNANPPLNDLEKERVLKEARSYDEVMSAFIQEQGKKADARLTVDEKAMQDEIDETNALHDETEKHEEEKDKVRKAKSDDFDKKEKVIQGQIDTLEVAETNNIAGKGGDDVKIDQVKKRKEKLTTELEEVKTQKAEFEQEQEQEEQSTPDENTQPEITNETPNDTETETPTTASDETVESDTVADVGGDGDVDNTNKYDNVLPDTDGEDGSGSDGASADVVSDDEGGDSGETDETESTSDDGVGGRDVSEDGEVSKEQYVKMDEDAGDRAEKIKEVLSKPVKPIQARKPKDKKETPKQIKEEEDAEFVLTSKKRKPHIKQLQDAREKLGIEDAGDGEIALESALTELRNRYTNRKAEAIPEEDDELVALYRNEIDNIKSGRVRPLPPQGLDMIQMLIDDGGVKWGSELGNEIIEMDAQWGYGAKGIRKGLFKFQDIEHWKKARLEYINKNKAYSNTKKYRSWMQYFPKNDTAGYDKAAESMDMLGVEDGRNHDSPIFDTLARDGFEVDAEGRIDAKPDDIASLFTRDDVLTDDQLIQQQGWDLSQDALEEVINEIGEERIKEMSDRDIAEYLSTRDGSFESESDGFGDSETDFDADMEDITIGEGENVEEAVVEEEVVETPEETTEPQENRADIDAEFLVELGNVISLSPRFKHKLKAAIAIPDVEGAVALVEGKVYLIESGGKRNTKRRLLKGISERYQARYDALGIKPENTNVLTSISGEGLGAETDMQAAKDRKKVRDEAEQTKINEENKSPILTPPKATEADKNRQHGGGLFNGNKKEETKADGEMSQDDVAYLDELKKDKAVSENDGGVALDRVKDNELKSVEYTKLPILLDYNKKWRAHAVELSYTISWKDGKWNIDFSQSVGETEGLSSKSKKTNTDIGNHDNLKDALKAAFDHQQSFEHPEGYDKPPEGTVEVTDGVWWWNDYIGHKNGDSVRTGWRYALHANTGGMDMGSKKPGKPGESTVKVGGMEVRLTNATAYVRAFNSITKESYKKTYKAKQGSKEGQKEAYELAKKGIAKQEQDYYDKHIKPNEKEVAAKPEAKAAPKETKPELKPSEKPTHVLPPKEHKPIFEKIVSKNAVAKQKAESEISASTMIPMKVTDKRFADYPDDSALTFTSVAYQNVKAPKDVQEAIDNTVIKLSEFPNKDKTPTQQQMIVATEIIARFQKHSGYLLSALPGMGKTMMAGLVANHYLLGNPKGKVVWVGEQQKWLETDGHEGMLESGIDANQIKELSKNGQTQSGINFTTYTTLRNGDKYESMAASLGRDFSGVIVLDESDKAAGVGSVSEEGELNDDGSRTFRMIEGLHKLLPQAKFLYMSGTPITKNKTALAMYERIGAYGAGTFFNTRDEFLKQIMQRDVGLIETLMQELRAQRAVTYMAHNYNGVQYKIEESKYTPDDVRVWDSFNDVFTKIREQIGTQKKIGNQVISTVGKYTKTMKAEFGNMNLNFHKDMMLAQKALFIAEGMRKDYDAGLAPVLYTPDILESMTTRAVEEAMIEQGIDDIKDFDLSSVDFSLKNTIKQYIKSANWAVEWEYDDESLRRKGEYKANGDKAIFYFYKGDNTYRRVPDSFKGQINDKTITKDNLEFPPLRMTDRTIVRPSTTHKGRFNIFYMDRSKVDVVNEILKDIDAIQLPEHYKIPPLDVIRNNLSDIGIAELTGRKYMITKDGVKTTPNAENDYKAWQGNKLPILIYSNKGARGRSMHNQPSSANQLQRSVWIPAFGFNANTLIQALGRFVRKGAIPGALGKPIYKFVETDALVEKRFQSVIIQTLGNLGATMGGSRDSVQLEVFDDDNNLMDNYSMMALREVFSGMEDQERNSLSSSLGIQVNSLRENNETRVFMNRIMYLPHAQMQDLMKRFIEARAMFIRQDEMSGGLDRGYKLYESGTRSYMGEVNSVEIMRETEEVNDIKIQEINIKEHPVAVPFSDFEWALAYADKENSDMGFYVETRGNHKGVVFFALNMVSNNQMIFRQYPNGLSGPRSIRKFKENMMLKTIKRITDKDEIKKLWAKGQKEKYELGSGRNIYVVSTKGVLTHWRQMDKDKIKSRRVVIRPSKGDNLATIQGMELQPDRAGGDVVEEFLHDHFLQENPFTSKSVKNAFMKNRNFGISASVKIDEKDVSFKVKWMDGKALLSASKNLSAIRKKYEIKEKGSDEGVFVADDVIQQIVSDSEEVAKDEVRDYQNESYNERVKGRTRRHAVKKDYSQVAAEAKGRRDESPTVEENKNFGDNQEIYIVMKDDGKIKINNDFSEVDDGSIEAGEYRGDDLSFIRYLKSSKAGRRFSDNNHINLTDRTLKHATTNKQVAQKINQLIKQLRLEGMITVNIKDFAIENLEDADVAGFVDLNNQITELSNNIADIYINKGNNIPQEQIMYAAHELAHIIYRFGSQEFLNKLKDAAVREGWISKNKDNIAGSLIKGGHEPTLNSVFDEAIAYGFQAYINNELQSSTFQRISVLFKRLADILRDTASEHDSSTTLFWMMRRGEWKEKTPKLTLIERQARRKQAILMEKSGGADDAIYSETGMIRNGDNFAHDKEWAGNGRAYAVKPSPTSTMEIIEELKRQNKNKKINKSEVENKIKNLIKKQNNKAARVLTRTLEKMPDEFTVDELEKSAQEFLPNYKRHYDEYGANTIIKADGIEEESTYMVFEVALPEGQKVSRTHGKDAYVIEQEVGNDSKVIISANIQTGLQQGYGEHDPVYVGEPGYAVHVFYASGDLITYPTIIDIDNEKNKTKQKKLLANRDAAIKQLQEKPRQLSDDAKSSKYMHLLSSWFVQAKNEGRKWVGIADADTMARAQWSGGEFNDFEEAREFFEETHPEMEWIFTENGFYFDNDAGKNGIMIVNAEEKEQYIQWVDIDDSMHLQQIGQEYGYEGTKEVDMAMLEAYFKDPKKILKDVFEQHNKDYPMKKEEYDDDGFFKNFGGEMDAMMTDVEIEGLLKDGVTMIRSVEGNIFLYDTDAIQTEHNAIMGYIRDWDIEAQTRRKPNIADQGVYDIYKKHMPKDARKAAKLVGAKVVDPADKSAPKLPDGVNVSVWIDIEGVDTTKPTRMYASKSKPNHSLKIFDEVRQKIADGNIRPSVSDGKISAVHVTGKGVSHAARVIINMAIEKLGKDKFTVDELTEAAQEFMVSYKLKRKTDAINKVHIQDIDNSQKYDYEVIKPTNSVIGLSHDSEAYALVQFEKDGKNQYAITANIQGGLAQEGIIGRGKTSRGFVSGGWRASAVNNAKGKFEWAIRISYLKNDEIKGFGFKKIHEGLEFTDDKKGKEIKKQLKGHKDALIVFDEALAWVKKETEKNNRRDIINEKRLDASIKSKAWTHTIMALARDTKTDGAKFFGIANEETMAHAQWGGFDAYGLDEELNGQGLTGWIRDAHEEWQWAVTESGNLETKDDKDILIVHAGTNGEYVRDINTHVSYVDDGKYYNDEYGDIDNVYTYFKDDAVALLEKAMDTDMTEKPDKHDIEDNGLEYAKGIAKDRTIENFMSHIMSYTWREGLKIKDLQNYLRPNIDWEWGGGDSLFFFDKKDIVTVPNPIHAIAQQGEQGEAPAGSPYVRKLYREDLPKAMKHAALMLTMDKNKPVRVLSPNHPKAPRLPDGVEVSGWLELENVETDKPTRMYAVVPPKEAGKNNETISAARDSWIKAINPKNKHNITRTEITRFINKNPKKVQEIWEKYGIILGIDGKMRAEIDDKWVMSAAKKIMSEDVFDLKELKNVPDYVRENLLVFNDPLFIEREFKGAAFAPRGIFKHEVFNEFNGYPNIYVNMDNYRKQFEAYNKKMKGSLDIHEQYGGVLVHEIQHYIQFRIFREIHDRHEPSDYMHILSEVEAREAQLRRSMSAQERAKKPLGSAGISLNKVILNSIRDKAEEIDVEQEEDLDPKDIIKKYKKYIAEHPRRNKKV